MTAALSPYPMLFHGCPRPSSPVSKDDAVVVDLTDSAIDHVEPVLVEPVDPTEITDPAGLLGDDA